MKLIKYLAAGILAISAVGTANAQTKIYITGSTAFRAGTVNAVSALLTGTGTIVTASDNASLTSANAVTWTGGKIGSTTVTIKASWSGSGAGIQTVGGATAANFTVKFLPDGATGTANVDPRSQTTASLFEAARPDIAMADNLQASTLFNGTFNSVAYGNLADAIVGVIPFRWVASVGFPSGKSMTSQVAQFIYSVGVVPVSFLTGANADESVALYASGRNTDSGTRVNAFAESGVGIFTGVQQYKPTVSGTTITALTLYPTETINGVSTGFDGNSGESSGGTLAGYMGKTLTSNAYQTLIPATNGYLLGYLGVSDAATAITAGGVPILWNGVDFTTTAVQEGQYTFWGYEHIMWRSTLGNGTDGAAVKLTFANTLKSQILATTPAALAPNVSFGAMQVSRGQEGAPITPNFF